MVEVVTADSFRGAWAWMLNLRLVGERVREEVFECS
jgi:hypothetical protein